MFGSWYKLGIDATMLAFESQQVIGMRLIKIAAGGAVGRAEAQRMVTEKVVAAGEAALMVASGASTAKVIAGYRRKVRANARRLSKG